MTTATNNQQDLSRGPVGTTKPVISTEADILDLAPVIPVVVVDSVEQAVPLARALHRATVVGQEIPPELYAAVAQVLAFVISRRSAGGRGGEHHTPRTGGDLPPVPIGGRGRRTTVANSSGRGGAGRSDT